MRGLAAAGRHADVARAVEQAQALRAAGRMADAEIVLRHAVARAPGDRWPRFHLAHMLLLRGRLAEAWPHFEARWDVAYALADGRRLPRRETRPHGLSPIDWRGEAMPQARVLLWQDEGLGDAIQCARFVALAAARARIVLAVSPALRRLFARIPGVEAVGSLDDLPAHEAQAPMLSLPGIFATALDTIPAAGRSLDVDPGEVARVAALLGAAEGLRVGLCWAGARRAHIPDAASLDARRSIPLAALRPLAAIPGVRLVSLQKGEAADEIAAAGFAVEDRSALLGDLAATGALIEALDLVISVDTAVAHLAGALGKRVWLLDRFDTSWRWMLDRPDSPWYDAMRIFRQPRPDEREKGDWDGVIADVASALGHAAARRLPPAAPADPILLQKRAAASAAHRVGRLAEAEAAYRALLDEHPENADLLRLLGFLLGQTGRAGEGEAMLRRGVAVAPDAALPHHALATFLLAAGRTEEAVEGLRAAVARDPDNADSHFNLAAAHTRLGDKAAAARGLRAGLMLQPGRVQGWRDLARLSFEADALEESLRCNRRAAALVASSAQTFVNQSVALTRLGRDAEAEQALRRAVAIAADADGQPALHLAFLLLRRGRWHEAWPYFQRRWDTGLARAGGGMLHKREARPPGIAPFEWRGETIAGRVLLWHEEGFGDTIQFCRYARLVAARARVAVAVPPPLVRLLERMAPGAGIEAVGTPDRLPAHDAQCSFLDLPGIFDTTPESVPSPEPYLVAPADDVARMRALLGPAPSFRIGIVWGGGRRDDYPDAAATDRRRSAPLAAFRRIAALPGVQLVSLQKGPPAEEIAGAGFPVLDHTRHLRDFVDTACLIANLDLVLAVDTAVAHLAAGVGVETWMLNRHDTDWRWLDGRADTPWYRSMRIFRQPFPGDWEGVLDAVEAALSPEAMVREASHARAADPHASSRRRAVAAHRAGAKEAAVGGYRAILEADPDDAETLRMLAILLAERGGQENGEEAERLLRRAAALAPGNASVLHALGSLLLRTGRAADALVLLLEARRLEPGALETPFNIAAALVSLGQLDEAEAPLREAIALDRNYAAAWRALGRLLLERDRPREAEAAFAEWRTIGDRIGVVAVAADRVGVLVDHAYAWRLLGCPDRAETLLREALALAPDHARAGFNLGHALALQGRLGEAWPLLEARWRLVLPRRDGGALPMSAEVPPGLAGARWEGEPIAGRLLLWHEQGLGDTIQFCRYVRHAAARATVVVACPAPLARLLGSIDQVESVHPLDALPPHERHCPFPSLPLAFGTTLETIPDAGGYLRADPAITARWRAFLDAPDRASPVRVGLCWAGQDRPELIEMAAIDRRRSLPLAAFHDIAALEGLRLVSLQKDPRAAEIGVQTDMRIVDPGALEDLAETAGLVACLDLVVTVDTAVAHLAGALGVPVWLLNRFDTDPRWLAVGGTSPWYDSMRIFRQAARGEWSDVLARVHEALAARIAAAARS